jgi:hypothetical protein
LNEALTIWDFPGQKLPHRRFWRPLLDDEVFNKPSTERVPKPGETDPLASNRPAIKNYVKMCFELLYRYNMLMQECGVEFNWERLIPPSFPSQWGVKTKEEIDGLDYHIFFV